MDSSKRRPSPLLRGKDENISHSSSSKCQKRLTQTHHPNNLKNAQQRRQERPQQIQQHVETPKNKIEFFGVHAAQNKSIEI